MKYWVCGVDFKTASLDERVEASRWILNSEVDLRIRRECDESLVLSTCNRVELYACSRTDPETWIFEASGMSEALISKFYFHYERAAVEHLFRVSSSLEAMVLGETQITGQVRRAYLQACEQSRVQTQLHRFFQEAFRVAKRVRTETEVGQFAVSIPSIGVKLAEKVLGDLSRRNIGILGLGEIGQAAAEHFANIQPKKLLLFNRTQAVAETLRDKMKGEGMAVEVLARPEEIVSRADVLILATSEPIFNEQEWSRLLSQTGATLFILDLAVPPTLRSISGSNTYLYYVDDLKRIAQDNTRLREQELERAHLLVSDEVQKIWRAYESTSIDEIFKLLNEKVELLRERELKELKARLSKLAEDDWMEIEKMSRRLSSKILQDPIVELKARVSEKEEGDHWTNAFKKLFKI